MAFCGPNRIYIGHPNFKWLDEVASRMPIAPSDFATRLKHVLQAEPIIAVQEIDRLTNEIFDLAEKHCPNIDLKVARAEFLSTEVILEHLPEMLKGS